MIINETYGTIAWLNGSIQLSNRARDYKSEKLKKLLLELEEHLKILKDVG